MKRLRGLITGVIVLISLTPFSLAGCSETTHVEERVNVEDDKVRTPVVTEAEEDVNVNVQIEGNSAPVQPPQIIEKRVIINETTNIPPEKKVEVHNHITNVTPVEPATPKEVNVNTGSNSTNGTMVETSETSQSGTSF